jgi:hypothetical protein
MIFCGQNQLAGRGRHEKKINGALASAALTIRYVIVLIEGAATNPSGVIASNGSAAFMFGYSRGLGPDPHSSEKPPELMMLIV